MTLPERAFAILLLVGAAAACNDSPSVVDDSIVGTYTLVSVNGQATPVVISTLLGDIEVLSGSLDVNGNGTCHYSLSYRSTAAGSSTATQSNDCTWTRAGAAAFFTLDNGDVLPATVDADTLTVTLFGATGVLRR